MDSGVGKRREARKHATVHGYLFITQPNVVRIFQFKSFCQVSGDVNVFGNKGMGNLQPDH